MFLTKKKIDMLQWRINFRYFTRKEKLWNNSQYIKNR